MSDITQALQLAFDKLGQIATTYGPAAVNTAAEVVRIDAMQDIVRASIAAAIALLSWILFALLLRWTTKAKDDSEAGAWGLIITCCCGFGFAIGASLGLANVWTWAALSNPKLVLAAKVVHALPGFGS